MFKVVLEYEIKFTAPPKSDPRVGQLRSWEAQTRTILQQEPGPAKRPIRWTSKRQQRYVMGFVLKRDAKGNIIPYQRTGKLAKAWVVEVDFKGLESYRWYLEQLMRQAVQINPKKKGKQPTLPETFTLITIDNPAQAERYVTGIQQQGFHKDTGWIYAPPLIEKAVQQAEHILGVEW